MQTNTPYGLIPVNKKGAGYMTGGSKRYYMPTNSTNGIYVNDAVALVAGSCARMAATPTTALSVNTPIGCFVGAKYIDQIGYIQYAPYIPPNAVLGGYLSIQVFVADDPFLQMKVLADGPVALTSIGLNAALGGFTAPTITPGNIPISGVNLASASIAVTTTLAVQIIDVLTPLDPFSDVIVRWNFGVHRDQLSLAE
jgi:hypothetical protein